MHDSKFSLYRMGQDDFSPSTQSMAKNFMFKGFDPEEYAKSISAQSDGDKDLIERRENIRVFIHPLAITNLCSCSRTKLHAS